MNARFTRLDRLMNCTGDQFFTGSGFTLDQNRRIRGSYSRNLRQHFAQRLGEPTISSNMEERTISSRNATVSFRMRSSARLRSSNVSSRREHRANFAMFIEQWVVAKQKPAYRHLCRACAFQSQTALHLSSRSVVRSVLFEIVWMKVPLMSLIGSRALHLFKGMSVIVEQHLVRLK